MSLSVCPSYKCRHADRNPLAHVPNGLRNSAGFDRGLKFHRSESFLPTQLVGYSEIEKKKGSGKGEREREEVEEGGEGGTVRKRRGRRGGKKRELLCACVFLLSVNFQI